MKQPINLGNGVSLGQAFGEDRATYGQFGLQGHHGQDMPAAIGTPIYAPESGTITVSGNGAKDRYTGRSIAGETIVVQGGSYEHWLMHLSSRQVSVGQQVTEGQVVGFSGNTGYSTGPHLHWGVRPNTPDINNGYRGFVNPMTVLATSAPAAAIVIPPTSNLVTLPAHVASWAVYRVGSGMVKGSADQLGSLAPARFGGLSYKIEGWIADTSVIITTQTYGRVAIWVKGTDAQFSKIAPPPAPPVAPPIAPYVPPAAPVSFPTDSTPYKVVKLIDGYGSATDAGNHTNPKAPVAEGDYYIFRKYPNRPDLINITKDLGRPGNIEAGRGGWINEADNVPDPIPEPVLPVEPPKPNYSTGGWDIPVPYQVPPVEAEPEAEPEPEAVPVVVTPSVNFRASYTPIDNNSPNKAHKFEVLKDFTIKELGTQAKDIKLHKGQTIGLYGTFEVGTTLYGRPILKSDTSKTLWYGVPLVVDGKSTSYVEPIEEEVEDEDIPTYATTPAERQAMDNATISDFLVFGIAKLERYLEWVERLLSGNRNNKNRRQK